MGQLAGLAGDLLLFQGVDQVDGGVETHTLAALVDGGHAQRCGEVGLSRTGAADQDDVLSPIREIEGGEGVDLNPVHLALPSPQSKPVTSAQSIINVYYCHIQY